MKTNSFTYHFGQIQIPTTDETSEQEDEELSHEARSEEAHVGSLLQEDGLDTLTHTITCKP